MHNVAKILQSSYFRPGFSVLLGIGGIGAYGWPDFVNCWVSVGLLKQARKMVSPNGDF